MKGYWLVLGTEVTDPVAQAEYGRLWKPIADKYQARINPGKVPPVLLEARDTARVIVVEFPSLAVARACYDDPEYQLVKAFAHKAATRHLVMFEGDLS